ncbi:MAG: extracellular solute-binding protein [Lachnospiraceae bacterium]|nr:extracellular solute-binding protein [Lachnospiraceae bacterium]
MEKYSRGRLSIGEKNWSTGHRQYFLTSVVLWLTCLFLLSACGSKEEEIPMGRYAEREVKLAGSGYTYMHPMTDGSYYLYGDGVNLTKVTGDGESSIETWPWENTSNINVKFSFGVADNGAAIFGYTPMFYSNEEYEDFAEDGEYRYLYYYVDEYGDKHSLTLYGEDYQQTINLTYFAFAPDGRLYAASDSMMYRINVESGEAESLFQTLGAVKEVVFMDDTMIALDDEKTYLYDMVEEKLLEDNGVLNEFVASHQNGSKSIVLAAVKESEAEKDNRILYLGCRTGLYRYVWGGSVIEQIADGRLLTFGNSQYKPLAMQALSNSEFRVLFSGNRMVELYYDETLPARPSKELTVYSLEDNGRIRYAGQLFQQEYPDVLVNYETGLDGDSAVSKEDALKNLNTKLLAGEGPDVIILDGIDMEQYAGKGVLKPLDELLAPYEEDGVLYWNIVEGMRMTEKEEIYGVPMTVYLPVWLSEKQYLGGEKGLSDIVAGMEQARADHPGGPLLFTPYPQDLLMQMVPASLPAWTQSEQAGGNGSLDVAKIEEFYQAAQKLWELDSAGLDTDARIKWQQDAAEVTKQAELEMIRVVPGQYNDIFNIGETWAQFGCLTSVWYEMTTIHCLKANFKNGYYDKAVARNDEVTVEKYIGQAEDVYWARTVTGICAQAKEPELAEEFVKLLLSEQMMDKWWLDGEGIWFGGAAIRKSSLAKAMDKNCREYAEVAGWDESYIQLVYDGIIWPTEEEKQWLYQMMEEADCCYLSDTMLEEVVKEVGLQVLEGSLTPEEGAEEVARKMAIEMEE